MRNVFCVVNFMLHEQNQHLRESRVLCACPLARHWCVCRVAGCLAVSPVPLQHKEQKLQPATYITEQCEFVYIMRNTFASFLTLDVYLLHFVDLCDRLSELLGKLPELLSARGAETHQLLLL